MGKRRYALQGVIGKGGAATVHLAKLISDERFERIVAVKRLHDDIARDEDAVLAFVDEAKLASRIKSAFVVPTLDVVVEGADVLLVMDYVAGETLSRLIVQAARDGGDLAIPLATAIVADVLRGLAAAHEAKSEDGRALNLVHRDVSPQNVLVGTDGIARLLDFGIAKAVGRAQRTRTGIVKGKLGYMAPEQLLGQAMDARADLWAIGVVLWEALTSERLFPGDDDGVVDRILRADVPPPSTRRVDVSPALDAFIARACARQAEDRFASAAEMLAALEAAGPRATPSVVADAVATLASESLDDRALLFEQCERAFVETTTLVAPAPRPRERRSPLLSAIAAVAGIAVLTLAVVALKHRATPETIATVTPSSTSETEPAESPSSVSEEEPSPSNTASPRSPRRRPATKNTPRPTTTTSTNKCNPPFTIDADGHKQWKRECF